MNQESQGIHSDLTIFANTLTSFSSGQFGSDELYKRSNKSKIPAEFVRDSKGIAIVTKLVGLGVKQIFGIGGTGLVLKNHGNGNWSGPSAFRMVTFDWFLGIGVDTSTYIFILNTDEAVDMFQKVGKFHHGAGVLDNIGGKLPIDVWAFHNSIYHASEIQSTYFWQRRDANEKYYGGKVDAKDILDGNVSPPQSAAAVYDALKFAQGL